MNDTLLEGTLGVVFTDIEGSTQLLRDLGARFDPLLARHHELMRQAISAGGGVEVRSDGDGFVALFGRPEDALVACVAAQRALGAERWPDDGVIRVRMGVHLGAVRPGGDNYTGLGIHQGSRVAPAAHGGQVVVSAAMVAALGQSLPEATGLLDLGAFHLRDFDGPQHLFQVLHPDLERSFPPLRVPSAAVHNLTPPRTNFVGRSAELNELVKVSDVLALLTIVGPGGVGKTRLASEVGLRVAARYPQGVWLVPLASVEGDEAVAEHVKTVLGLGDRPGLSTIDVIAERLGSGPAMIILDNCEHVLAGCVELVEALLAASATTAILATSREHLGVLGEEVFRLGPLDLPAGGAVELEAAGAVELFVARGAQARRGFSLTEENAAVIEAICRRLDGIPLALELAAARLSTMGLSQLLRGLDDALGLLGSGRRGGDDRQRTLRATLEWSYRRLGPDDQTVFGALYVFRGHFTLDAAEAVVGGEMSNGHHVVRSLERLVAQSLVELDTITEPARYRLLETNRAYAAESVDEAEAARLADNHATFYSGLARAFAEEGWTPANLDRVAADHPNLLGALETLTDSDRPGDHGRLVVDLWEFWDLRGHWQLARQQQLAYLARASRDPALDGEVLGTLGDVASALGDYAEALVRYEEALTIARDLGDRRNAGRWEGKLGVIACDQGNFAEARARFEEALAIGRQLGDRRREGISLGNLARVALALRNYPEARTRYEEALAIAGQLGDRGNEGICVGSLGVVAYAQGDYSEARARFDEALTIARQLGDRRSEWSWIGYLGDLAYAQGEYAEARVRFEEALAMARHLDNRPGEAKWVGRLGAVALAVGDDPEARARFEEALAAARQLGDRQLESFCVGNLGAVALAAGDYAEARVRYEQALAWACAREQPDSALLEACADLLARRDRVEAAAEVLAAAEHLGTRMKRAASEEASYNDTLAICVDGLDDAALALAAARGRALGWPSAAETALQYLGRL